MGKIVRNFKSFRGRGKEGNRGEEKGSLSSGVNVDGGRSCRDIKLREFGFEIIVVVV